MTVPGRAISGRQRDALMQMPAFSDEGDPLFGAAVRKYRDANAGGAARAVATGAVDIFGRPPVPVYAAGDGKPADVDGRPMAEAQAGVGRRLDAAAAEIGTQAAAAALQGALNDLGDAQVAAETAPDGLRANRMVPRIVVDGVIGPQTRQALRLALHRDGDSRLGDALDGRLRQFRSAAAPA